VARAAINGLATVALATGVPVALGVLTVTDPKHARRRAAAGPDNKGAEAARAAVATARALQRLFGFAEPRRTRSAAAARAQRTRRPRRAAQE
jgi:hypothetical protein